jgi:maltooligosyltrehalose trehalohydrolase
VHDGQYSTFRARRFGAPADDLSPERFVVFGQNHDQVGNRAYGDRLPRQARPLAAFATLLAPFTPMLFMGEEYGEDSPFQFFSDHIDAEIATATREGRRREFAAFAQFGEQVPDPQDEGTFQASKLSRAVDPEIAELYAALLAARRELPPRVNAVEWDEDPRWLRIVRGRYDVAMNFADHPVLVPCAGTEVVVAAGGQPTIGDEGIELPPLSGALVR